VGADARAARRADPCGPSSAMCPRPVLLPRVKSHNTTTEAERRWAAKYLKSDAAQSEDSRTEATQ